MIGPITIKRAIKRTTGWAAVVAERFAEPTGAPRAIIFYYHRIVELGFIDSKADDWNVPPAVFEKQLAALSDSAEIVSLIDLPQRLASPSPGKPLVCLTFDDGYLNFHTQALPLLKRYNAPATVFVVTSLVGHREPLPFDGWSLRNHRRCSPESWRPMGWAELESCVASGIVTVGAHSHKHLKGRDCPREQLVEEAERSRAILKERLGEPSAVAYAYPYGSRRLGYVSSDYVEAVKRAGFQLAVTTDLGIADSSSDKFLLPRIEAHPLDNPLVIRAKAAGALAPYYVTDRLRRAARAV